MLEMASALRTGRCSEEENKHDAQEMEVYHMWGILIDMPVHQELVHTMGVDIQRAPQD
jgi:hypothetical protein